MRIKCVSGLCIRMVAFLLLLVSATGKDFIAARPDPRIYRLERFFEAYGCARPHHTVEYIRAADAHAVDYRLLPAISVVESTCGEHQRLNNYWGWNSARTGFPSVESGIRHVTAKLAHARAYRDKTIPEKLAAYNPVVPGYHRQVERLMNQIE